jgi:hypothetical protein
MSRNRRVALAAFVLPALVLAAGAARSPRPFRGDGAGDRAASSTFVDTVFTLAAVLLVVLVGVLIWARLRLPKRATGADQGRFSLGALVIYLAIVTGAFLVLRHGLEQPRPVPEGEGGADPAAPLIDVPETPQRVAEPGSGPEFVWPLAARWRAARSCGRRSGARAEGGRRRATGRLGGAETLQAALDEAIKTFCREPDPRRAVVAAYARMEQALTVSGWRAVPRRRPTSTSRAWAVSSRPSERSRL